jgi:hypothetical protein
MEVPIERPINEHCPTVQYHAFPLFSTSTVRPERQVRLEQELARYRIYTVLLLHESAVDYTTSGTSISLLDGRWLPACVHDPIVCFGPAGGRVAMKEAACMMHAA